MNSLFSKRTIYTFVSAAIILTGTLVAIQYAKGNWRNTNEGMRAETGLLAANSFPTGAQVYIDNRLITATDDTIYLEPKEYQVKIVKDGYSTWSKTVKIEKELVVQTNAKLFPIAASLSNLTFTGVQNISTSPDGQKLIYYVSSASAEKKNGLYLLELVDNPISLQKGPKQISGDSPNFNLTESKFIWSPDSSQVMVLDANREVLLPIDKNSDLDSLSDISFQKKQILSEWEQEMYLREQQFIAQFPDEVIYIATTSAKNIYISPDKKKLLYTATAQATIPDTIVPPVPATNSQPEERLLQPGRIYIYDREEDKNFLIGQDPKIEPTALVVPKLKKLLLSSRLTQEPAYLATASANVFTSLQASESAATADMFNIYHTALKAGTFQWFPDSRHLIFTQNDQVKVVEYDNTNETIIYSGPFAENFIYPWPDGSRLLILTSFSPNSPINLYAIELK